MESIARSERSERQVATSPLYHWEVPQKPVSVRIPFDLIDRLEHDAVESFRSLTSRGSEIGGLLLGTVQPGSPAVVTLTGFEPVACDYARGPLYRLSDSDLGRFERAIEQHREGASPAVVGFYRSHTRKGLALDSEDLAFFEARFRNPQSIVLLVRPFASKASIGGIFFRENGSIRGEASCLEFPFQSAQLTGSNPSAEHPPASVPTPPPAPPKPPTRAPVVPIATRREVSIADSVIELATRKEEPVAEAVVPETPVRSAAPPALPVPEPPAPAAEPQRSEALAFAGFSAAASQPPLLGELPEPETKRNGRLVGMVAAAAAVVLLFVVLVVYPGYLRTPEKRPAPASVAQADSSPLSLRVDRRSDELLLTWNREAEAIRGATGARLSISDGDRHENYDMDLEQLRKGSIVYVPMTADVNFRMEVIGQNKEKTASELVRVLRSSPMPGSQASKQVAAAAAEPGNESAASAEEAPQAKQPSAPRRAFRTESLAARLRPASQADLPDAPALAHSGSGVTPALNFHSGVPSAPPAAPSSTPAQTGDSGQAASAAGGSVQTAELLVRRDPQYPQLARQNHVKGAVEVEAVIGPDGKVKRVTVVRGHPLLRNAAIEAVSQWVYRPAMLRGVPVETKTQVVLNFVGAQ